MSLISSSIVNLVPALKKIVHNPSTVEIDPDSQNTLDALLANVIKDNTTSVEPKIMLRISQAGVAAPVINATLKNTLAAAPVFAYSSVGIYTLAGVTTTANKNKTDIKIGTNATIGFITAQVIAGDVIQIKTFNVAGAATDVILNDCNLTITIVNS